MLEFQVSSFKFEAGERCSNAALGKPNKKLET